MGRLQLPTDRMPEAEVSLRLAFHLLAQIGAGRHASVAIDGAQVRVGGREIFPVIDFLLGEGWQLVKQVGKSPWQGHYEKSGKALVVHARSGEGDVVTTRGSKRIRAECKGGPVTHKPGSKEYPLLRQLIGQLMTVKKLEPGDVMVAAVPATDRFRKLAHEWADRPLMRRSGILIVLVGRGGHVEGLKI